MATKADRVSCGSCTELLIDRSNVGALYTGLAIATDEEGQTFLYVADDGPNRRVDVFDGAFNLVKSFGDPAIPRGFLPGAPILSTNDTGSMLRLRTPHPRHDLRLDR